MVGRKLKKGFEEFKPSFEALKAGKPITKTEKYVSELLEQYEQSSVNRGKTSLDKGTQRKTTENELPSLTQCTA